MVQKVIEKREEIDWRRTAAFSSFGFLYLGGVQYALYVPIFSRMFPNAASFAAKTVAEKLRDWPGIRSLFSQVRVTGGRWEEGPVLRSVPSHCCGFIVALFLSSPPRCSWTSVCTTPSCTSQPSTWSRTS